MDEKRAGKALIVSRHCVITHHSPMNCLAIRSWRSNVYNYCYNIFLIIHPILFIHERKEIYWMNERNKFISEVNEVNDGVKWMGYSFRYVFTSFTLILLNKSLHLIVDWSEIKCSERPERNLMNEMKTIAAIKSNQSTPFICCGKWEQQWIENWRERTKRGAERNLMSGMIMERIKWCSAGRGHRRNSFHSLLSFHLFLPALALSL